MSTDVEDLMRTQLDAHVRTAPPAPALGELVERCEVDLARHHRRVTVAAAGLVAAAVVAAVTIPTLVGGDPRGAEVANDARSLSDAQLIEVCREGSQPAEWNDRVFGSGTPRVAARSGPDATYSSTILVSADGSYWADCFNAEGAYANTPGALADDPGRSSMRVFANESSEERPSYGVGGTCPRAELLGCDGFFVDYVDRLPLDVGAVEFTTVDGVTTAVNTTVDGFVVFDHVGVIPVRVRDRPERASWITKIVYLAADGTPLAGDLMGAQRAGEQVDGLPPLTEYPSRGRSIMDVMPGYPTE